MIKTVKTCCWRGEVVIDSLWSPHWVLVCALGARGGDWWNNCLFLFLVLQKMNKYQQFNPWAVYIKHSQYKGCGRRSPGSVSDCWQLAATDLRPCLCHRPDGTGWITSSHFPSLCHHHHLRTISAYETENPVQGTCWLPGYQHGYPEMDRASCIGEDQLSPPLETWEHFSVWYHVILR